MGNQRAIAGRVTTQDQVKKRQNNNNRGIERSRADTIHVEVEDGEEEFE